MSTIRVPNTEFFIAEAPGAEKMKEQETKNTGGTEGHENELHVQNKWRTVSVQETKQLQFTYGPCASAVIFWASDPVGWNAKHEVCLN